MGNAAATRAIILNKAYELIYINGYQSTSIDDIISATAVTKGAFYYNFKNKEEMGLAVINEVIYPRMYVALVEPLKNAEDPVEDLYNLMNKFLLANPALEIKYGCPANNLVQEMAPLNRKFNAALSKLMTQWKSAIEEAVKKGIRAGKLRKDVSAEGVATFIISGYGGVRNMGKMVQNDSCYKAYLKEFRKYLEGLQ
jgi:TetR/AcrR family transcriptional regulator, transcriptional repressor for nem operon